MAHYLRGRHERWSTEGAARHVILSFRGQAAPDDMVRRSYTASLFTHVYFNETVSAFIIPQVMFRPQHIMAYVCNPVRGHRITIEQIVINNKSILFEPVPIELFENGTISRGDLYMPLAKSIKVVVKCELDRKVYR